MAPNPKNFSFPSIVIIFQSMWSLSLRFFLQTISIVRYKILWLKVEKKSFHFFSLAHMSISTYLRPNIHQNGPEILGVNFYILHLSFCFKNILYIEDAPKHVPTIWIFNTIVSSVCLLHWKKRKKALYVNFDIPPCGIFFSFYCWKIT
jgi:hypothetical protein